MWACRKAVWDHVAMIATLEALRCLSNWITLEIACLSLQNHYLIIVPAHRSKQLPSVTACSLFWAVPCLGGQGYKRPSGITIESMQTWVGLDFVECVQKTMMDGEIIRWEMADEKNMLHGCGYTYFIKNHDINNSPTMKSNHRFI